MKRVLIAFALAALSGCASVSGLRQQPADLVLTSTKAPTVVGQCVAGGWGEFYGVKVNQAPTADGGYTVSMPSDYSGNNGVLDAMLAGGGSKVEVRYRLSSLGGYQKFTDVVKRCV